MKQIVKALLRILGKKWMVNLAFEILDEQAVSQIPYTPLVGFFRGNYERSKNFIQIFLDKNPKDDEQMRKWWQEEKLPITDETFDFMREIAVLEIKDEEKYKKLLAVLDKLDPIPNV